MPSAAAGAKRDFSAMTTASTPIPASPGGKGATLPNRPSAITTGSRSRPRPLSSYDRQTPGGGRVHHRLALWSALGELVDPRSRGGRERAATHEARLLEIAQALGQDVGADVGQSGAQIGEALGAQQQLADDEEGPALADEVEGPRDPAAIAVGALGRHGTKSTLKLESPCL